ncbi:MAG: hypothetical protein H7315_07135 [Herminiimonas sp.]|nr:hypothetical protein [Herminiimonas sp.]
MQIMLHENQIAWGPPSFRVPEIGVRLEQGKPFHQWLFRKGPAPDRMNCWESVLYGAFRAGLIDKAAARNMIGLVDHQTDAGSLKICSFIKNILDRAGQASTIVTNLAARSADHLDMRCIDIPAGHVVLFGEDGQHVALSLGANEVLELDSDSGGGDHQGRMAISRIDTIMNKKAAYARQLAWAPLI